MQTRSPRCSSISSARLAERRSSADFDLAAFVWAEFGAQARRLLHEVDALGRAYGWTEGEVLALGERRRAAYVDLALENRP